MKQVININFQGRVIPIEVTALDQVKQYIESLKLHFAKEEGMDEIINDIEGRIGELFHQKIKLGAACITDVDVEAVIRSIGRPEQFDSAETTNGEQQPEERSDNSNSATKKLFRNESSKMLGGVCAGIADYFNIDAVIVRILFIIFFGPLFLPYIILWIALPGTSEQFLGAQTKKLFRDPEEKIIAGVCAGLGKYFGVHAWVPRIIFLIPLLALVFDWDEGHLLFPGMISFTLSPGSLLIYFLLWLVIPMANTATEKLQMRGAKVDIGNLQNRVLQEAKQISSHAKKWEKEISETARERISEIKTDVTQRTKNSKNLLGSVLIGFFKTVGYIIIGLAAFIFFIIIFSLGVSALAIFPLKDFILQAGWQNGLAWLTLIFLVIVPLAAALIWIIRRIIRVRSHSKSLRLSFLILWLLGLISGTMLLMSSAADFRYQYKSDPTEIKLSNPHSPTLAIKTATENVMLHDLNINIDDILYLDSIPLNQIKLIRHTADSDSFRVFIRSVAYGRSTKDARKNSLVMHPAIESVDSLLNVDAGIYISRKNKFRLQQLILEVYIPKGKSLIVEKDLDMTNADVFNTDERNDPTESTNI